MGVLKITWTNITQLAALALLGVAAASYGYSGGVAPWLEARSIRQALRRVQAQSAGPVSLAHLEHVFLSPSLITLLRWRAVCGIKT
jgi:hypothetical protein